MKVWDAQTSLIEMPQLLTHMGGAAHEEVFGNPGLANRGAFMEQPCKHKPVRAFGLAERQSVDPQTLPLPRELERVAFRSMIGGVGAIALLKAPPALPRPQIDLQPFQVIRPNVSGNPAEKVNPPHPFIQKLRNNPSSSFKQSTGLSAANRGNLPPKRM